MGRMTGNLYYGDNLGVLRENVKDESVDLVYLDPPFNSNATYNVLFKAHSGRRSQAQIAAFEDTWHWGNESEAAFLDVLRNPGHADASNMLRALRESLRESDMLAYLAMMTVRLIELHRVLKPTGSVYLHCDPTASHYLKIIMDRIFGVENFRSEIIWQRSTGKALMTRGLPANHDVLLCFQMGERSVWNSGAAFIPYDANDLPQKTAAKYSHIDPDGRHYQLDNLINPSPNRPNLTYEFLGITRVWRWTRDRMEQARRDGLIVQPGPDRVPRFKRYLDEQRGMPLGDVWTDIPPLNSQAQERLGYPTQKPLALLERLIKLSSNEGDLILDPFCGCGTTIHAAEKLDRNWIGMDVTHLAISLIERRLGDAFPLVDFTVHGTPKDLEGARDLARRDKYQFQWWAVSLVDAVPFGGKKKGADSGIDGWRYMAAGRSAVARAVVSVKGGETVGVQMVRDLRGVMDRENAEAGLLLTLIEPTRPMLEEAARAGLFDSPFGGRRHPRLQILTVGALLLGVRPDLPPLSMDAGFRRAGREDRSIQNQGSLLGAGGLDAPAVATRKRPAR